MATLVAASLALVRPASGLVDPSAHEFLLVHPIFSHHDSPDKDLDHDEPSAVRVAVSGVSFIAPAGPLGEALGLSVTGLLAGSPLAMLVLPVAWPLAAWPSRLAQQAWVAVPTPPPR